MDQQWITITGHRVSLMAETAMASVLTCGTPVARGMDIGTTILVKMQEDFSVKKTKVNQNMIT